jgi:Nitrate reductase delta subunit
VRWELLRALGAVAGDVADAHKVLAALGLESCDGASHTAAFVLNCPPYASVYLGAEGRLGGSAADRVAGFWRAIGVPPPAEPDHLTSLLDLYAALGSAADAPGPAAAPGAPRSGERSSRARLAHARRALFSEHLWPWVPGYLGAVADLGIPALGAWADLAMQALEAEQADLAAGPDGPGAERPGSSPDTFPLALREAPPPLAGDESLGELLGALVAPIRSGIILTRRALAIGAGQAGAGHRIGERRFTLRAMLEQEPERTLAWLADEADRWSARHAAAALGDPVHDWWATRAFTTATVLRAGSPIP